MTEQTSTLYSFHSVSISEENNGFVHLLPEGNFQGRDGRGPYVSSAVSVIKNSLKIAGGADLPIDYEHQGYYAKENGKPAAAAGWIKELEARDDGIWGKVEWTYAAKKMIEEKEYRYLSPVIKYLPKTGEVMALSGAGLTNLPNLSLTALSKQETDNMNVKTSLNSRLATILKNLPEDDEDKIFESVKTLVALNKTNESFMSSLKKALDLSEENKSEEVLQKIEEIKKVPTELVPLSKFNETAVALNNLEQKFAEKEAYEAVSAAMREGKVSPALKDWAIDLHKKNKKAYEEFLKNQPVIIAGDAHTTTKNPVSTGGKLSDAEIAICNQLDISEEDYLKNMENK